MSGSGSAGCGREFGAYAAIATTPEIDGWYKTIDKPTWNPPDYVFGPVWTALYILEISGWLNWRSSQALKRWVRTRPKLSSGWGNAPTEGSCWGADNQDSVANVARRT